MGRTIISLTTMLGLAMCCGFLGASCAAAAWRGCTAKTVRLRLLVALLVVSVYSWFMFTVTMRWQRGPGYIPDVWVLAAMVAALALGALLAIRTGTAREALTATGTGVVMAVVPVIVGIWSIRPNGFLWVAICVAVVPTAAGMILAPALLYWRLNPDPAPPPPWAIPPHRAV